MLIQINTWSKISMTCTMYNNVDLLSVQWTHWSKIYPDRTGQNLLWPKIFMTENFPLYSRLSGFAVHIALVLTSRRNPHYFLTSDELGKNIPRLRKVMNRAICRLHTTVAVIHRLCRQSADCPCNLKSADCAAHSADCANPQIAQNRYIEKQQGEIKHSTSCATIWSRCTQGEKTA